MWWRAGDTPKPKEGSTRYVTRFTWLPTEASDGYWYWLEVIWVKQIYSCVAETWISFPEGYGKE
jgi:hypothetical protein